MGTAVPGTYQVRARYRGTRLQRKDEAATAGRDMARGQPLGPGRFGRLRRVAPRLRQPFRKNGVVAATANLGLEGVVAFETEIAEPDREGSALRYRGVDIEELGGKVPFEQVWGLVVNESLERGLPLPGPECEPVTRSGDARADLQATLPTLAPRWGLKQLVDIDADQARDDLARLSSGTISIVAQALRGDAAPVQKETVEEGTTAAEQFMLRWHGELDETKAKALDVYWVSAAEHGMNASTFTARIAASTGADCAACIASAVGSLSGPLHGGAPARVLPMLDAVAEMGDAERYVSELLGRGERIMGFGHRVYRAEDPRSRVLKRTATELGSPRVEVAAELEEAAIAALREKYPDRPLETNVEFWGAIVLELAEIPAAVTPALFACARTAGWSAHIVEQKLTGRLIRPSAKYVGPPARQLAELA
jgi:citrate synthase